MQYMLSLEMNMSNDTSSLKNSLKYKYAIMAWIN